MENLAGNIISVVFLGLGATLTFDLWALFLKRAFNVPPSNMCLVGRWVLYILEGTLTHATILTTPPKRAECATGWFAHYTIGLSFALVFVVVVGVNWLEHPTLIPAMAFGIATVLAPFFILQPSFGFGIAASKTAKPAQARVRSLMNHAAFGLGLYVFGLLGTRLFG